MAGTRKLLQLRLRRLVQLEENCQGFVSGSWQKSHQHHVVGIRVCGRFQGPIHHPIHVKVYLYSGSLFANTVH